MNGGMPKWSVIAHALNDRQYGVNDSNFSSIKGPHILALSEPIPSFAVLLFGGRLPRGMSHRGFVQLPHRIHPGT